MSDTTPTTASGADLTAANPSGNPSGEPPGDPLVAEILDLTDRRRVLLHLLFGGDPSPGVADEVFTVTVDVTNHIPEPVRETVSD